MDTGYETALLWPNTRPAGIEEERHCHSFCLEYSRKSVMNLMPGIRWVEYDPDESLGAVLASCEQSVVVLVANPKILLRGYAVQRLSLLVHSGAIAAGPVYNHTEYDAQRAAMPYAYLSLSSYEEICRLMEDAQGSGLAQGAGLDPSCIAGTKSFFLNTDPSSRAGSFRVGSDITGPLTIDPGVLVHNFGDYYSGQRDDLVSLVPQDCKRILDVGCAAGEYGRRLKQADPGIFIAGIEFNPAMASLAKHHYDQVLIRPVEDVDLSEPFDLVNFGDVLEHLPDPWKVLQKVKNLLRPGGYMVLSVPNAGHWTVVMDLLQGRFEYVPWGLLCITHIRWFTEQSIIQAIEQAGLAVDLLNRQQIEPTPRGKEFISWAVEQRLGNKTSLLTNEIIIRARKK